MHDQVLNLALSLSSLPDYAVLEIGLPVDVLTLTVEQLLDTVFPGEESEAATLVESFDTMENPDFPEIYEEFSRIIAQYRFGLCELDIANQAGVELGLPGSGRLPCLTVRNFKAQTGRRPCTWS